MMTPPRLRSTRCAPRLHLPVLIIVIDDDDSIGGRSRFRVVTASRLARWGWQDNEDGTGVAGPAFRFGVRGDPVVRVMTREDGLSIDQIVISSGTYRTHSPGALKDDTTVLPQCATPPLQSRRLR